MSKYEIHELPQIVHQLQIIILGSMIEMQYTRRFMGQKMDPAQARVMAMQFNSAPNGPEDARLAQEAYHHAIRLWKASRALGMSATSDHRKMDADTLIMAGL